MVEYNDVKDLTGEEIRGLIGFFEAKVRSIALRVGVGSREETDQALHELELSDFTRHSLSDILLFRHGYLKMDLPAVVTGDSKRMVKSIAEEG